MSDSDDDSIPNNVFTIQNDNTTISARGQNINNTNITGLSFPNNILTSTMHMPVNFERQRLGNSYYDQRNTYYRRGTSPMSLRSIPDYGPSTTLSHSTYQNGVGQRSIYNGRAGSPMSLRSIDSTASVSAADIVFAFKNVKFNKYDLRIIKDAYNKLIKTRQRKRIEKRRNLKLFFKGTRQKSGEDSGEQGSDSSLSSDDCRSVRTMICKENIPALRHMKDVSYFNTNIPGGTYHMTNVSNLNPHMNQMVKDCTENIKQNTLRNMTSVSNSVSNFSTKERNVTMMASQDVNPLVVKQNTSIMTQKERFKKGFLLPSQRFNKTIAGQTQLNTNEMQTKKLGKNIVGQAKPTKQIESSSDQEDIFKGFTVNQNADNVQRKRFLETEGLPYSNKKQNKSDSPKKLQSSVLLKPTSKSTSQNSENVIAKGKSRDFIFAKPKMPIKKVNTKKSSPEKLLAKSNVPAIVKDIDFIYPQNSNAGSEDQSIKDFENQTHTDVLHSNSDVSMRPSFIKRKLFTQKLDVAEHKNTSCDSLGINSPQNIYSASMRERNKARKLVTSQSCLSREVPAEENNVLDLIHKIVPPDQINSTNIPNKTELCNNKSNNNDSSNKWDVTAIIANCDNQDISDTYTDEEIFNVKNSVESKKPMQSPKKDRQRKVIVEKLQPHTLNPKKANKRNEVQNKIAAKETIKKSVTDCVKSFWDTDFESDMDFDHAPSKKTTTQQNQDNILQNGDCHPGHNQGGNTKKVPNSRGTILTVRNRYQSILNNSLKSRRDHIGSGRNDLEFNKPDSIVKGKGISDIGKKNNESNVTSQTVKNKDIVKTNVAGNNKKETGRKPKARECIDCVKDIQINSHLKANNGKLARHNKNPDDQENDIKKSSNNGNVPVTTVLKSKDLNNANIQKENVNNRRIQPKRKSKDKSFVQSSTQKTVRNITRTPKTKSTKEFLSKNTSINNMSTIMTRSKKKLSFNSSQSDCSSINLSNISNRSLRLRQRV